MRNRGFDSRREYCSWKVRSAWCRHRSRKPGGARASGFDSCTFRYLEDDFAAVRAPFAKRVDLVEVAVRLRRFPRHVRVATCCRKKALDDRIESSIMGLAMTYFEENI